MRNTATEVKSEVAQRSLAGSVYVMFGKSVYQPTAYSTNFTKLIVTRNGVFLICPEYRIWKSCVHRSRINTLHSILRTVILSFLFCNGFLIILISDGTISSVIRGKFGVSLTKPRPWITSRNLQNITSSVARTQVQFKATALRRSDGS
jgi:hypothetical protein